MHRIMSSNQATTILDNVSPTHQPHHHLVKDSGGGRHSGPKDRGSNLTISHPVSFYKQGPCLHLKKGRGT